jgi:tellurite resistance protein
MFKSILKAIFDKPERMVPLQLRIIDEKLGEGDGETPFKSIEGKGLFPLMRSMRVGVRTSVFDTVDGDLVPVLSVVDAFQENLSTVYQWTTELGHCEPNQGYLDWVRFAPVFPSWLTPPYGEYRSLKVYVRLIDLDNPPPIRHGFHTPHPGLIWQESVSFGYKFEEKGYLEAGEDQDQARVFSIKLGVAVAMADGGLDDAEGLVIKRWIQKTIEPHNEERTKVLKDLYNKALRDSYALADKGELSLSDITADLMEIGESAQKYEAIELCFDIMAADGIADPAELKTIHSIAEALELDWPEIERLRDQRLLGLSKPLNQAEDLETIVGIDKSWPKDKIKKHLSREFQKWNGRVTSLEEGPERDTAQQMLDSISEARKKYA